MTTPSRLNAGALALAMARQRFSGKPYVFGGVCPPDPGTDCSGVWYEVYTALGIPLKRSTYDQYTQWAIPNSWPSQPGDLLFIPGSDPIGHAPGHVMGFVSDGLVFQAPYTGELIDQYAYNTNIYEYRTRPALYLPVPPTPTKAPSQSDLIAHGYVRLLNPEQAQEAKANGWQLYIWNGIGFTNSPANLPVGTPEYASIHWQTKNPNVA
jgi:hypothetical protein